MHGKSTINIKRLRLTANSMLLVFSACIAATSPFSHAGQVWALDDSGQLFSYDTAGAVGGANEVPVHQNFEGYKAGVALSGTDIQAAFPGTKSGIANRASPGVTVVTDPGKSGRGNVLRVSFPKDKYGNNASGAAWQTLIPKSTEYYFAFDMYVPVDFKWPLGCKLPGLFGGDLGTVTGQGSTSDGISGWAARQDMHSERKDGDTAGFKNVGNGNIGASPHVLGKANNIYYNYALANKMDVNSTKMTSGKWMRIEQRVKLNTVSNTGYENDGIYEAWVDGVKVFSNSNWVYRIVDTLKIDAVNFIWYYGGSGSSWGAREDQYMFFDNFVAWTPSPGTSSQSTTSQTTQSTSSSTTRTSRPRFRRRR